MTCKSVDMKAAAIKEPDGNSWMNAYQIHACIDLLPKILVRDGINPEHISVIVPCSACYLR